MSVRRRAELSAGLERNLPKNVLVRLSVRVRTDATHDEMYILASSYPHA